MKRQSTLSVLVALTLLAGCATPRRGPAYGHEQEFRRQVGDSVPVKDWGYRIQDIKFSEDYQKVLVVFTVPGKADAREVVLENDGFRRYKATVFGRDAPTGARTRATITVIIPGK